MQISKTIREYNLHFANLFLIKVDILLENKRFLQLLKLIDIFAKSLGAWLYDCSWLTVCGIRPDSAMKTLTGWACVCDRTVAVYVTCDIARFTHLAGCRHTSAVLILRVLPLLYWCCPVPAFAVGWEIWE